MAIMTGVQSAQVLGPSTQRQADQSKAALGGDELEDVDVGSKPNAEPATQGQQRTTRLDGGHDRDDRNNGLDVIR